MENNLESLGKSIEELKGIDDKVLANQKIDEVRFALSAIKKENKKAIILDKKKLSKKKIAAKKEKIKNVLFTLPKKIIEKIKGKLGLIPVKIEQASLNVQNAALEKANNIKYQLQENKKLRAKKIHEKRVARKDIIVNYTKSKVDLLKQKLNFEKNTVKFKNAMSNIKAAAIEVENKALSGAVAAKNTALNMKDNTVLKGKSIKQKISNTKNTIKTVSKKNVDIIRDSINAKKDQIYEKVDQKLYNLKNKTLLAKEKIARKVEHTKNVVARTTGMRIALLKESISKKMQKAKESVKNFVSPSEEVLQSNQERIAQLKEERSRLINEFMGPAQEETRAFAR